MIGDKWWHLTGEIRLLISVYFRQGFILGVHVNAEIVAIYTRIVA